MNPMDLTGKVYKATLDYYTEKQHVAPVKRSRIKSVYEDHNKFERIVVPFTDGIKFMKLPT
jgi:preprotein translocase subunit SecA